MCFFFGLTLDLSKGVHIIVHSQSNKKLTRPFLILFVFPETIKHYPTQVFCHSTMKENQKYKNVTRKNRINFFFYFSFEETVYCNLSLPNCRGNTQKVLLYIQGTLNGEYSLKGLCSLLVAHWLSVSRDLGYNPVGDKNYPSPFFHFDLLIAV